MFHLKQAAVLVWLVKEWKQDCTHVAHNQFFPLPFKIIYTNIVLVLKPRSAGATTN